MFSPLIGVVVNPTKLAKRYMADGNMSSECHDLVSLLSSEERDFLVRNNGDEVKIKDLSGKTVGLYFSASWCPPCRGFTPVLSEVHKELSPLHGDFEVVFISSDRNEESFKSYFSEMPWLAIPLSDKATITRLRESFKVMGIPHLVIIDGSGKVSTDKGVKLVREYGIKAYPFTAERINQLKEEEEEAKRNQTLKSILVSDSRDYVIKNGEDKVPVSNLVGKHILLYFSAHWCPPCRFFTPQLIEAYHEIKAKEEAFEVVFVSSDRDQSSFDEYYSGMPWLALPFGDGRKVSLSRRFKVRGIPSLIAIGPDGKTVTTEARDLIDAYGADAFPFTEDHAKHLKQQLEEEAKGWPEKLRHKLHEHELLRIQRPRGYTCDGCKKSGQSWSFYCKDCDFDLHPNCALKKDEAKDDGEAKAKEGYICDGDVCRKV